MTVTVKGFMFDFSGTLLRIEPAERWLRAVLDKAGITLAEQELAGYAGELSRAGGQPGGASPEVVPEYLEQLWREPDLSAEHHRAAYTGLARQRSAARCGSWSIFRSSSGRTVRGRSSAPSTLRAEAAWPGTRP